jgi:hypothetical protein
MAMNTGGQVLTAEINMRSAVCRQGIKTRSKARDNWSSAVGMHFVTIQIRSQQCAICVCRCRVSTQACANTKKGHTTADVVVMRLSTSLPRDDYVVPHGRLGSRRG